MSILLHIFLNIVLFLKNKFYSFDIIFSLYKNILQEKEEEKFVVDRKDLLPLRAN